MGHPRVCYEPYILGRRATQSASRPRIIKSVKFMKTIKITEQQMKKISDILKDFYIMKNASPSEEDDGSMIAYWENQTGRSLQGTTFKCPKCNQYFKREELDGSHVVMSLGGNHPQYITPLCQHCNRERDDETFYVAKIDVVPAP